MKNETKKILLIGRSGRGKSTLANVLLNKNDEFEEIFKESAQSISQTRKIQSEEFEFSPEQEKLKNLLEKLNREIEKEEYRNETRTKGIFKLSFLDKLKSLFNKIKGRLTKNSGNGDKTKDIDVKNLNQEQVVNEIIKEIVSGKDISTNDLTLEDRQTLQKTLHDHLQKQKKEGKKRGVKYRIIDTPGIGDTKLTQNEVLDIIAEAVYLVKDGLSQALFVTNGRFDQFEMNTYDLLRETIFDQNITNHTTIIRTCFNNFRTKKECEEDINKMIKEGGKLAEIIESCCKRVIHVNNPSLEIAGANEDKLKLNKVARGKSREKLLNHLSRICQEISYKPSKLQELSTEIADYMESKIKLEAELKKLKTGSVRPNSNQSSQVEVSKDQSEIFVANIEKDKEFKELVVEGDDNLAIGERIAHLEDKKTKLKKEIADKEKVIRQKVLKHIFNNYSAINQESRGDIFLESVIGDHNWEKINLEFKNRKLVVKWLSQGFDYHQVQKWATVLEDSFNPKHDADFCTWLRDIKELTVEKIRELNYPHDIEHLREEYASQLEKEIGIFNQHNQKLSLKEEKTPAQEWLNNNYLNEEKENIVQLDISGKNLVGDLDCSDFSNLTELCCSDNQLTSLNVSKNLTLTVLDCHQNQLTALDISQNLVLTQLYCSRNQITSLDVSQNKNLTAFYCYENQLTSLDISQNKDLNFLHLSDNKISDLKFLSDIQYPRKLTYLDISNNNFSMTDLESFQTLVNLTNLSLGNNQEDRISKGIYNRFVGSLAPLRQMSRLYYLDIDNTDINCGLENLPDSLKTFYYSSQIRPLALVNQIVTELKPYNGSFVQWKEARHEIIKNSETTDQTSQKLLELTIPIKKLETRQTEEGELGQKMEKIRAKVTEKEVKILELDAEVKDLKKKLKEKNRNLDYEHELDDPKDEQEKKMLQGKLERIGKKRQELRSKIVRLQDELNKLQLVKNNKLDEIAQLNTQSTLDLKKEKEKNDELLFHKSQIQIPPK